MYIGSADMMTRNTEKRVEVACPILDPSIRERINHYLDIMLADNLKARSLQPDGTYIKKDQSGPLVNSQEVFMEEALAKKPVKVPEKKPFISRLRKLIRR